jgi:hypothetical protein
MMLEIKGLFGLFLQLSADRNAVFLLINAQQLAQILLQCTSF